MKRFLTAIGLVACLRASAQSNFQPATDVHLTPDHRVLIDKNLPVFSSRATGKVIPGSLPLSETKRFMKTTNSTVALSQDFMYAARTGEDASGLAEQLRSLDYTVLHSTLQTDVEKKAFWMNLYNGFTQYLLRQEPGRYKNRGRFFKSRQIIVAHHKFSLDDIEHGILRRSKIKLSLGYLDKPFPKKVEKELRVDKLDSRIHFALNCGAKSCPPIAFYSPENLDRQLELATKAYLSGEVQVNEKKNQATVPAVMGWFRHDFGGKKGMRDLLRNHGYTAVNASTRIRFNDYDWSLYLENAENL